MTSDGDDNCIFSHGYSFRDKMPSTRSVISSMKASKKCFCDICETNTVDCFIFVSTNFCGLNKNHTFMGFKIRGHSVFLHYIDYSYRKSLCRGHWNSWIGPSTKTTKIRTPRKLSTVTIWGSYFLFVLLSNTFCLLAQHKTRSGSVLTGLIPPRQPIQVFP